MEEPTIPRLESLARDVLEAAKDIRNCPSCERGFVHSTETRGGFPYSFVERHSCRLEWDSRFEELYKSADNANRIDFLADDRLINWEPPMQVRASVERFHQVRQAIREMVSGMDARSRIERTVETDDIPGTGYLGQDITEEARIDEDW